MINQNLSDVDWRKAERWIKRDSHRTTEMRSGQSRGPVKMWICDLCTATKKTLGSENTAVPSCSGGISHPLSE